MLLSMQGMKVDVLGWGGNEVKRDRTGPSVRTDWTIIGSNGANQVGEHSRTYVTGRKSKRRVTVANGVLVKDERVAKANPELAKLAYSKGEKPLRPSVIRYHGTGATLFARESAIGLDVAQSVPVAGARQQSHTIDAVNRVTPHFAPNARGNRLTLVEQQYMPFKSKPDSRDRIAREIVQAQSADDRRKELAQSLRAQRARRIAKSVWK